MWPSLFQPLQTVGSAIGEALSFVPPWVALLVLVAAVTAAACVVHLAILATLRRLKRPYLQSVLAATKNPARLGLALIVLAVALPIAPVDGDSKGVFAHVLGIATICLIGWIAVITLHITSSLYLARFRMDVADNLLARKHITQVRVLRSVLDTVIVTITVGFALMTFDPVRQYGVSLFASAGVAGIIAGLGARPVLSNLFAGVQLAVTQPIRLEDAVTVENEYGWIEEITSTYVVIRLWDLRRLILPLTYFIEKPFYNWTRQAVTPFGSVTLYLDYAAPVELIRQKAIELVGNFKEWHGSVINVQVTNATAQSIELRVLVNSSSVAATSNLCAALREQLIAFLQREHPEALPRQRSEAAAAAARQGGAAATLPAPPGR